MAAVGLLYVGAVLFVNGLALMGIVKGTALVPMNLFVGLLQVITPLYIIFTAHGNQGTIVGASGLFLFGFTYLYVAMNNVWGYDGTGLGWFSLFVAITACAYSYWNFSGYAALSGSGAVGNLLGVLWLTWAVLWTLFWLVLGLGKVGLTRFTGAWTAALGICTGLIPALVLLNIPKWATDTFAIVIAVVCAASFLLFLVTMRPTWSTPDAAASAASEAPKAYA